ncbi:MAG TPA: amidase, partial [Chloroflexota bacterium]|nr:amidase [Chloroflexota bacterium]
MRGLQISPVEIVRMYLDRIEEINSSTNAVVTLCGERAMAEARAAERSLIKGESGRLTGLPFTVKDTIETAGVRTTAGSKMRANELPRADAPVVARFRELGAILLGKTNTSEFAMTFGTDNALFGRTINPWNGKLTPGGSSGGEAALIAAGGSSIGLASDLGGSIRIPAHFCGVCGLRPTVGAVPFRGHVPDLPGPLGKLAVIGPMTRHIDDLSLALGIIGTEGRLLEPKEVSAVAYFVENGIAPATVETADAVRSAS